ncbi:Uma2 family endonuclease [Nocardioides sp.]|uniref:Uma2 family endonuclease n=1 Tax=Nocardioides sp. TaxID=35761 RepID=UPI0039E424AC
MSYEEWLALPEQPKTEWVDGWAVIYMAPPGFDHSDAQAGLPYLFRRDLRRLYTGTEPDIRLPGNRIRRPDFAGWEARPDDYPITSVPLVVAEVLSPGTRSEDLLRKGPEYAAAGVAQYWVVDPESRTLEVSHLVDGAWQRLALFDATRPSGEVAIGDLGVVHVDLGDVFSD